MFVRLRRSALAARLRSFFTSEDNRTLKTAVFLLVIATAMYCKCHAFCSIRLQMRSAINPSYFVDQITRGLRNLRAPLGPLDPRNALASARACSIQSVGYAPKVTRVLSPFF